MEKLPIDLAVGGAEAILNEHIAKKDVYAYYDDLREFAKKKYRLAERVFVVGNPGAGKSSLVEVLKREGFLASLWRVSESSIPCHTAGIVPSIYQSKHYGRVIFYDFAGDPEYYSSHAAVLENLVSREGDNVIIIVVDLRADNARIRHTLYYWISFIQYQNFARKSPSIIVTGSHHDLIAKGKLIKKRNYLRKICTLNKLPASKGMITTEKLPSFMLDCREPKSPSIVEIQKHINSLTRESPRHKLSTEASLLLGLLEKDFNNVTALSLQQLQDHIKGTGVQVSADIRRSLYELHEVGLLFIITNSQMQKQDLHIVLNTTELTNTVHREILSEEASENLKEKLEEMGYKPSANIGMLPQVILKKVLPDCITKQCLVQLQYWVQKISMHSLRSGSTVAPTSPFCFFQLSVKQKSMMWRGLYLPTIATALDG